MKGDLTTDGSAEQLAEWLTEQRLREAQHHLDEAPDLFRALVRCPV